MDINDKIDLWHTSDGKITLHEFLGMTWEEYVIWVQTYELPDKLKYVYTKEN